MVSVVRVTGIPGWRAFFKRVKAFLKPRLKKKGNFPKMPQQITDFVSNVASAISSFAIAMAAVLL